MRAAFLAALILALVPSCAVAGAFERFYPPGVRNNEISLPVSRGPDGRVWVGLRSAIGAVDRDGSVQLYDTGGLRPSEIAWASDGALWFIAGRYDRRLVRLVPGVSVRVFAPGV